MNDIASESRMEGNMENFSDRAARLHRIVENSDMTITKNFPLLVEVLLDEGLFVSLASAMRQYLRASLSAAVTRKKNHFFDDDILVAYYQEICSLTNITPNGAVMPKREVTLEFNLAHRCIAGIFKSFGIDCHVASIHLPAGIRLVDGKKDATKDSRPYSSTKLHTDFWSGDPLRSIVIFIPVLGDVASTTLEFFEPAERGMKNLMRTLSDYDEGASLMRDAKKYLGKFRCGFAYIGDSLILHRTVKNQGGLRVSVNFRFAPQERLASDDLAQNHVEMNWHRNYVPLDEWYAVGDTMLLVPQESFAQAAIKFVAGNTSSQFIDIATYFRRVRF